MQVAPDDSEAFEVMHPDPIRRVELAMDDLRQGRMVILVDDEDRENEGDLIVAAEKITPETINFMATHARGLICLSLTSRQVERLALPMMAANNQSAYYTAFTVSIEAREGVTTGISAHDRAQTVSVAIRPDAVPRDIVTPGHVFPLRARDGGVLERVGQTEGSVDLARLAGLDPSGVICEIMNPDGSMARLPELLQFGQQHRIRLAAVADIIKYRMRTERVVRREGEGQMAIDGLGTWRTRLYGSVATGGLHQAFWRGSLDAQPTLVRVQAAPPPWSFLGREATPLGRRGWAALQAVDRAGSGAVVFMHLASPAAGAEGLLPPTVRGARRSAPGPGEGRRPAGSGDRVPDPARSRAAGSAAPDVVPPPDRGGRGLRPADRRSHPPGHGGGVSAHQTNRAGRWP